MRTKNNINQLSQERIANLMDRYYSGEKVKDLIREFSLIINPSEIVSLFPRITLEDSTCLYCQQPMVIDPPTRSSLQSCNQTTTSYCLSCGHKDSIHCNCSGCEEVRAQQLLDEKNEQLQFINDMKRPQRTESIKIEDMSFRDVIDLISLARVGLYEDTNQIFSLSQLSLSLCCRQETAEDIVQELYTKGYIDISYGNADAVYMLPNGVIEVDYKNVEWQLTIGVSESDNLSILPMIDECLHNQDSWPKHWYGDVLELWRSLALDEILAYLELRLNEHHFDARFGDKTIRVFKDMLTNFSIYKIYNFIWGAVTNAAAYQVRAGISRRRAANTVIGNCQQRAERAITEKWSVKDYRRDPRIPNSSCINLFANVATELGEQFYSEPPSSILITKHKR